MADVPAAWAARGRRLAIRSPVLKVNCALDRLPTFNAATR